MIGSRAMWLAVLAMLGAATGMAAHGTDALDAHALGINEGLLKYCTTADAADAPRIKSRIKHLWQSAAADTVARIRHSAEYRSAYGAVTDFVSKVDAHNARLACSRSPSGGR